jgi:EAL domain-containing protein (putative c-di-GMP-specific phosphodiesterase class I)/CheY-like chemotaxis protein
LTDEPKRAAGTGPTPGGVRGLKPSPSVGRVLIVEDDPSLLEAYSDILMDEGFDVTSVPDGEGALRALEREAFEVVLSDVVMPGGTGLDVLHAVRERDLDVPVVLVTGSPSVETAIQALEMGALRYLLKPVAAGDLVKTVKHAARLRELTTVRREALRYLGRDDGLMGDRAGLESVFNRAMGALYMVYQPIVRTVDGSVFAWEALLRTREPTVAGPLAFIEMAERLSRVRELGRTIRGRVAKAAKQARGVMFFVNLHHDDLLDEALYDPASPLTALAPEVVFEITERSPVESVPDIRGRVARLRALGFRLAVDDLGSGYAGLTSFASLQPDFVKLDRGLIEGLDCEPVKRKLVGSITAVSHDLGIAVVAEGVETPGEREAAASLGCELMQGYLFRRPEELNGADRFFLGAAPP